MLDMDMEEEGGLFFCVDNVFWETLAVKVCV